MYEFHDEKSYRDLARYDILKLQVTFVHRGNTIEQGEMFEYIEQYNRSVIRVTRISTGKTYKIFVSKFIRPSSMVYVPIFLPRQANCIWNKTK